MFGDLKEIMKTLSLTEEEIESITTSINDIDSLFDENNRYYEQFFSKIFKVF